VLLLPFLVLASITLDQRIATVEAVVRELAQKSGQDLRIKPELADEVLFVSLKPHTGPELMALVAKAASAEWIQDGATYLGRSASFRRKAEKEERADLANEIEATRRPLLDPNDSTPWSFGTDHVSAMIEGVNALPRPATQVQDAAYLAKIRAFTPHGRFLSRALRSIPAKDLAAIPLGTFVRFAERPNRWQRALPLAAGVEQYRDERKQMGADFGALPPIRQRQAIGNLPGGYREPIRGLVTPILQIGQPLPNQWTLSLRAYREGGRLADFGSVRFLTGFQHTADGLPRYNAWKSQSLKAEGTTAVFVDAPEAEARRPEVYRKFLQEGVEPLALLETAPISALAAAMGKEAVIALPDELATETCDRLREGPATLGGFADGLSKWISFELTGDIVVGHARRPIEFSANKTNRVALRSFVRSIGSGFPGLDPIARYALVQNKSAAATWFESIVMRGVGTEAKGESASLLFDLGLGGRELLRVYAALPPTVRAALRKGARVSWTQLPPSAREDFESMLSRRQAEVEGPPPTSTVDPTLLGNNFLGSSVLSLTDFGTKYIVGYPSQYGLEMLDLPSLGLVLGGQDMGEYLDPSQGYPIVTKTLSDPDTKRLSGSVFS
jgi:hypothetical protein